MKFLFIDPSSMTRWRTRIREAGAEELLKETIEAGLKLKAVKSSQLARINVDTTVQEKIIRFPTDKRRPCPGASGKGGSETGHFVASELQLESEASCHVALCPCPSDEASSGMHQEAQDLSWAGDSGH